jgi:hypothetical protein
MSFEKFRVTELLLLPGYEYARRQRISRNCAWGTAVVSPSGYGRSSLPGSQVNTNDAQTAERQQ